MGASREMFEDIREKIQQVENGDSSFLEGLLYLREFKDEAEKVLEKVKDFENKYINEIDEESRNYSGVFRGFEIKSVAGRKSYDFSKIAEIKEIEQEKKKLESKYKTAFEGILKAVVQTTKVEETISVLNKETGEIEDKTIEVKYWIDENGELKKIPELSIGKSYVSVKKSKK